MNDHAVIRVQCETWRQFKLEMEAELFNGTVPSLGRFLYRGVRSSNWSLIASYDRMYSSYSARERLDIFPLLLQAFRKECWKLGIPSPPEHDHVALQALGQHHGLPTRLLDWSESPYVAGHFAFSGALQNAPRLTDADDVAIWALDTESVIWSESSGVVLVEPDDTPNDRVRRQAGRFTYSRTPFATLEEYVVQAAEPGEAVLWQFSIPASEAHTAMAELELMGITSSLLFPDIEGGSRAAVARIALARDY